MIEAISTLVLIICLILVYQLVNEVQKQKRKRHQTPKIPFYTAPEKLVPKPGTKRPGKKYRYTPETFSLQSKVASNLHNLKSQPPKTPNYSPPEALTPRPGAQQSASKYSASPTPQVFPAARRSDGVAHLKSKAYQMSPADPSAPDRLAVWVSQQYPGKSDRWVWEKVIADLERDRR